MAFNMADYEPVEARITRFWEKFENGRIITEIVERTETDIIVKASVWTDREDERPAAVDFAHEIIGSSAITKTSWLEVCATSAIGRALANLGFSPKGKRPSREEMQKVASAPRDWIAEGTQLASDGAVEALRELYKVAVRHSAPKDVLEALSALGAKASKNV